jgi:hypothetical protein
MIGLNNNHLKKCLKILLSLDLYRARLICLDYSSKNRVNSNFNKNVASQWLKALALACIIFRNCREDSICNTLFVSESSQLDQDSIAGPKNDQIAAHHKRPRYQLDHWDCHWMVLEKTFTVKTKHIKVRENLNQPIRYF